MKRIFISLVLMFILSASVYAAEHYVKTLGITVTVPDTYMVFKRGSETPGSGKTVAEIESMLDEGWADVWGVDIELGEAFIMSPAEEYENIKMDLRTCNKDEKEKFLQRSKYNRSDTELIFSEEIETKDAVFMKFHKKVNGKIDWSIYTTVVHGHEISIMATKLEGYISPEQEQRADNIVRSIQFDDTLKDKQAEELIKIAAYEEHMRELEKDNEEAKKFVIISATVAVMIAAAIVLAVVLKKRKIRERDAIRSASVTRHCRSCGEPISESSEICPSCGTRQ